MDRDIDKDNELDVLDKYDMGIKRLLQSLWDGIIVRVITEEAEKGYKIVIDQAFLHVRFVDVTAMIDTHDIALEKDDVLCSPVLVVIGHM